MSVNDVFCAGCGIKIQTVDEKEPGYAPPGALQHEPVLCRRCFRMQHYNELEDISMTGDDFIKLLSRIASVDALVVYVIDIFDVAGSWVDGLQRVIGENPVLLVGNKMDLLPKSTNPNKLKTWLHRSAKQHGLHPVDVLMMSAEKNLGIDEVGREMDFYRKGRDVYIVGTTNVGKSTLINHLIRAATGGEAAITTSRFPGTTLNFIGIALDDGRMLYDTPGVVNPHQAAHFVDERDYKKMMPNKEIKPRVYQLNEQQTLFLGGLGRVDYLGPGRRSLVVYVANGLTVHRTRTSHADDLYRTQFGKLLAPPDRMAEPPLLERHDHLTEGSSTDIVFSGLGWVTVKGSDADIAAYAPAGIGVSFRSSIIKG